MSNASRNEKRLQEGGVWPGMLSPAEQYDNAQSDFMEDTAC